MDWTKNPLLPEFLGTVWLSLIQDIVACGRKVYSMEPTTTQKPSTTTPPSHREPCLPEEVSRQGCINGGECCVITIGGHRHTHCVCPDMWWGSRCQYFKPPVESRNFFNARTANMAAGLSVVLLLVIVIIIAVYVYIRLRRNRKRREPPLPLWSEEKVRCTASERPETLCTTKLEEESQTPLNGATSNNTHDIEMTSLSQQDT